MVNDGDGAAGDAWVLQRLSTHSEIIKQDLCQFYDSQSKERWKVVHIENACDIIPKIVLYAF